MGIVWAPQGQHLPHIKHPEGMFATYPQTQASQQRGLQQPLQPPNIRYYSIFTQNVSCVAALLTLSIENVISSFRESSVQRKKLYVLPFYPSRYVRGLLPLGLVYSRRFGVTALLVSHTYMIQSGTKAMDSICLFEYMPSRRKEFRQQEFCIPSSLAMIVTTTSREFCEHVQ